MLDSEEELDFCRWIAEARTLGLVTSMEYHPRTFDLSDSLTLMRTVHLKTKSKPGKRHVFHAHVYTPDFYISVTEEFGAWLRDHADIFPERGNDGKGIFVEIKGAWLQNDRFPLNQKWVWQVHGILINKVVCDKLFKLTWVPDACLMSPKKHVPKLKWHDKIAKNTFEKKKDIRTAKEFADFLRGW